MMSRKGSRLEARNTLPGLLFCPEPEADCKTAWAATPKDKQDKMIKECQDAAMSKPHAEFCANLMAYGGANKWCPRSGPKRPDRFGVSSKKVAGFAARHRRSAPSPVKVHG
ncbi:MAG: hypothetical protein E5V77_12620 [Mesorhizobium sp.]|nr:MAG: hypothetical protein E5V77_12620 [Mesorhizobium sp.]